MPSNNPVHWKSGVMAINPHDLKEFPASIFKVAYDESNGWYTLQLFLRRDVDSLESHLEFTYDHWDIPESEMQLNPQDPRFETIDRTKLPRAISGLYEDFGVSGYLALSDRLNEFKIKGIYYGNALLGIKRE